MDAIITTLFFLPIACLSSAIMLLTHRTEKRGCGRGCATCPNRKMCHKKTPKGSHTTGKRQDNTKAV